MNTIKKNSTENEIIWQYAPLVKKIAHHLMGRLPASIQVDDLIQAGMIGLLEAYKHFNDTKGASFSTYAGIRIRGAMLDEIRRCDWAPRSVHKNSRMVAEAMLEFRNKTSREAKDFEIANLLKISLDDYHKILLDTSTLKVFAFDDIGINDEVGIKSSDPSPLDGLQNENFRKCLAENIASLPEKERLVLALYYDEDLNLREVGEVLGVSESRVSQIHGQAMVRLQAKMQDWK